MYEIKRGRCLHSEDLRSRSHRPPHRTSQPLDFGRLFTSLKWINHLPPRVASRQVSCQLSLDLALLDSPEPLEASYRKYSPTNLNHKENLLAHRIVKSRSCDPRGAQDLKDMTTGLGGWCPTVLIIRSQGTFSAVFTRPSHRGQYPYCWQPQEKTHWPDCSSRGPSSSCLNGHPPTYTSYAVRS